MKKLLTPNSSLLIVFAFCATLANAQTNVKTLFGRGGSFDLATQLTAVNATTEMKGANIAATFVKDGHLRFKTESLRDGNAVAITFKNTGKTAVNPKLQVASQNNERTDLASLEKPLAPGATATLVCSFVPSVPWVASDIAGKWNNIRPGTGTKSESMKSNAIYLFADEGASLEISNLSLIVEIEKNLPAWLGRQPPVPQAEWKDWKKTFDENFDKPINFKTWNIYTPNWWEPHTHYSKDNVIIKDGKVTLRFEKKRGPHNDDPNDSPNWSDKGYSDYACGYLDTFGKWTQRYGYFEARLKIPRAEGLTACFWMMPDRGYDAGPEQWKRADTGNKGMEFDIMENLTGWGPYRFNQAFHWDGYNDNHKAVGSAWVYVRPDGKDDFFTVGMLWLPGKVVYYANGREVGRWENERICSVQSNFIISYGRGGWDNTPFTDEGLPADYVIDYVRAWQRADLATPEDGSKPNSGRPGILSQNPDGK